MGLQVQFTGEDLLRMEGDYELVRGELVEMTRPGAEHGMITMNVGSVVRAYTKSSKSGIVVTESGFYLARNPDTVRGPDVAYYSNQRIPSDRNKYFLQPPELAAEVVSPNDTSSEVEARVRDFLQAGVEEVWVLYPRTRTVHRYRQGWAEVLTQDQEIVGVPFLPGFTCALSEFFED